MICWRITSHRGRDAVSGEGARLFGGRWNRPGLPAVYASEHLSLAVVESLVHLDTDTPSTARWVIRIDLPGDLPVHRVEANSLEAGWEAVGGRACERAGNAWLDQGEGAVLIVPSALVPEERNIILNPEHPAFDSGIPFEATRAFSFDRLLR
jgi:RES domain-containing protein